MSIPRTISTLLGATALTLSAGCDTGSAAPGGTAQSASSGADGTAERCLGCHAGPMSLSGRDTADVADTIRAIVAGERTHPPLQLSDTSDGAVADLAERLTASGT